MADSSRVASAATGTNDAMDPSILCLSTVMPIGTLLARGLWSELVLPAAWLRTAMVSHHNAEAKRVFTLAKYEYPVGWFSGWPSKEWMERQHGKFQQRSATLMSLESIFQLETNLKRWAPSVISAQAEADDRADEERLLTEYVTALASWRLAFSSTRRYGKYSFTARELFKAIQLTTMVKGGPDNLKDVCRKALDLMADGLGDHCNERIEVLPSATHVRRHMLTLDLAYLLLEQKMNQMGKTSEPLLNQDNDGGPPCHPSSSSSVPPKSELEGPFRFGLADGSPAWGYEWLWAEHTKVQSGDDLLTVFYSGRRFIEEMNQLQNEMPEWPENIEDVPESLRQTLRDIAKCIEHHVHTPVVMASGYMGLAHKLAGCLHMFALGRPSEDQLISFVKSFVSWTSDFGTEVGFADFRTKSVRDLLPGWMTIDPLVPDMEVSDDQPPSPNLEPDMDEGPANLESEDLHSPLEEDMAGYESGTEHDDDDCEDAGSGFLFGTGFAVPALLHMIHNMCSDLHDTIKDFDYVWKLLKNCESLLAWKFRRERLITSCARGVARNLADGAAMLRRFSSRLYEKRWRCVIIFITNLKKLFPFLRRVWDEKKFRDEKDRDGKTYQEQEIDEAEGGKDAGQFDPSLMTDALNSGYFKIMIELYLLIEGVVWDLTEWGESCPCHYRWNGDNVRRRAKDRLMAELIGMKGYSKCPFAGCNAPPMAAGKLLEILENLLDLAFSELLLSDGIAFAKAEDIELLHECFEHCKNHLLLYLRLKLNFWQKVPYIFIGMAHWDLNIARRCAEVGRQQWQRCPEIKAHHRLTVLMCYRYAGQLDKFIQGASLASLSRDFQLVIATFMLIPIVERSIERKHALVKMALYSSHMKGSAVHISLSNRLPILASLLERMPALMEALLECFDEARKHYKVAYPLGLDNHPLITNLQASDKLKEAHHSRKTPHNHNSKYTVLLRQLVYRADEWTPSVSLREEQNHHLRARAIGDAEGRRSMMQRWEPGDDKPDLTYHTVAIHCALEHLKRTGDVRYIYSLPQNIATVTSLNKALDATLSSRASDFEPGQQDITSFHKVDTENIHFRITTFHSLSRAKTVSLSAPVQEKFNPHDLAITMYHCSKKGHLTGDDKVMLYVEPLAESSHMSSPSAVLTSLGSDSEALEKYFLVRPTIRGMEYLIPSITPRLGDQAGELHGLLSSFISKGAVEGAKTRTAEGELNWMTFDKKSDAQIKVLDVLKSAGIAKVADDGRSWQLTEEGLQSISYAWRLGKPFPVLTVREGVALEDATSWEVLKFLDQEKWTWRKMPSRKPEPYKLEDAKVWYTSGHTVVRPYLLALLNSKSLLEDQSLGLTDGIHHGQASKYYESLLKRKRCGTKRKREVVRLELVLDSTPTEQQELRALEDKPANVDNAVLDDLFADDGTPGVDNGEEFEDDESFYSLNLSDGGPKTPVQLPTPTPAPEEASSGLPLGWSPSNERSCL